MQTCMCVCIYIYLCHLSSVSRAITLPRLPTKKSILMWVSICCLASFCLPHLSNTLKKFSSLLTLTEFTHKRRKLSILLLFSSVPNFTCAMWLTKLLNTRFPKSNKNLTFFCFPAISIVLCTPNTLNLMANLGKRRLEVLQ